MGGPFSFASHCLPVFRIVDAARIGSLSSRAYGHEIERIRSPGETGRGESSGSEYSPWKFREISHQIESVHLLFIIPVGAGDFV